MKSYRPKEKEIERKWYHVDLEDKTLGRVATRIARVLIGKHKPIYHPAVDTGDFVIVTNVKKVRMTGNKMTDKQYHKHTGYPGGMNSISYEEFIQNHPI